MPTSVSQVVKKSDFLANARFDEHRKRGNEFHEAVAQWWNTGKAGSSKDYQDWIDTFINYKNLKDWEPMAVEYALIDRRYNIAGTLDLLLKNKETGRIALCDYKTQKDPGEKGKIRKVNHRPQLGGYLSLLWQRYPQIPVHTCRIYYVTSKQVVSDEYDPTDCMTSYEAARSLYFEKLHPF